MQIENWIPAPDGRIIVANPDKTHRLVCVAADPQEQILVVQTPHLLKSTLIGAIMVAWIKAHIPEDRWPAGLNANGNYIDSTLAPLKEWTCD